MNNPWGDRQTHIASWRVSQKTTKSKKRQISLEAKVDPTTFGFRIKRAIQEAEKSVSTEKPNWLNQHWRLKHKHVRRGGRTQNTRTGPKSHGIHMTHLCFSHDTLMSREMSQITWRISTVMLIQCTLMSSEMWFWREMRQFTRRTLWIVSCESEHFWPRKIQKNGTYVKGFGCRAELVRSSIFQT